jgi:hypothetical protein
VTEFWITLILGVIGAAAALGLGYIIGWDRGHQKAMIDWMKSEEERALRVTGTRNLEILQSIIEQRKAEYEARTKGE